MNVEKLIALGKEVSEKRDRYYGELNTIAELLQIIDKKRKDYSAQVYEVCDIIDLLNDSDSVEEALRGFGSSGVIFGKGSTILSELIEKYFEVNQE